MLKKRAIPFAVAILLSGCGTQAAAPSESQTPLPPTESASATAPIEDEIPIPAEAPSPDAATEALLASLVEPDSTIRGGRQSAEAAIFDSLTERNCDELADWLGRPIDRLDSLVSAGYSEVCATNISGPLTGDGTTVVNGEEVGSNSYFFYIPQDTSTNQLTVDALLLANGGYVKVSRGGPQWLSGTPTSNPTNIAGGYAAVKTPTGEQLALQNFGPVTAVNWVDKVNEETFNISAYIPASAVDSYRLISLNKESE